MPVVYYAVANSGNESTRQEGIYTSWSLVEQIVKDPSTNTFRKGAVFKKFETIEEAKDYLLLKCLDSTLDQCIVLQLDNGKKPEKRQSVPSAEASPAKKAKTTEDNAESNDSALNIYTDGACHHNGKDNAYAGSGVYFSGNENLNVSCKLPGEVQTNQRAELYAIDRALDVCIKEDLCAKKEAITIHTDSDYSKKCITEWISGWEKKGWVTSKGTPVKNADLIKGIHEKLKTTKSDYSVAEEKKLIKFKWVKGHSDNLGNDTADKLAGAGARKH